MDVITIGSGSDYTLVSDDSWSTVTPVKVCSCSKRFTIHSISLQIGKLSRRNQEFSMSPASVYFKGLLGLKCDER